MSKETIALASQLKQISKLNAQKIEYIKELKEALLELSIAASIVLDPLDEEEMTHPVYEGIAKAVDKADKLLGRK